MRTVFLFKDLGTGEFFAGSWIDGPTWTRDIRSAKEFDTYVEAENRIKQEYEEYPSAFVNRFLQIDKTFTI